MTVYIILLLIILCLLSVRHTDIYTYGKYVIMFFIFIFIFILCVYRSIYVGTDYPLYYSMYSNETFSNMINGYTEPGFAHLVVLAQHYNNFLIITTIVFLVGFISVFLLSKQFNVNKFTIFSFLIITGFYFQMFSALRQMLAIGIVYIGLSILFKYKNHRILSMIIYLLLIIFAFNFHKTALFGLIFLILPRINYSKRTVIISGILTTILFIFGKNFVYTIMTKIPYYGAKYMGKNMSNTNPFGNIIQLLSVIIQFIFLYIIISGNIVKKNRKGKFILSGYLLYLCMFALFGSNAFRRLQIYTFIFPMLFSCIYMDKNVLYNKVHKSITPTNKSIYMIFWCLLYLGKLISNKINIIPYSFI